MPRLALLCILILMAGTPAIAGAEAPDGHIAAAEAGILACLADHPDTSLDVFAPATACAFAGEQECRESVVGANSELDCLRAVQAAWIGLADSWGAALIERGGIDREGYESIRDTAMADGEMLCDAMTGVESDDAARIMRTACQTVTAARIATYLRYLAATLR